MQSKWMKKLVIAMVSITVFLCIGIPVGTFYHKMQLLDHIDQRLKKIESIEGRVRKLHREISASLTRNRRSTSERNETNEDGSEENDTGSLKGQTIERPSCNIRCGATGGAIYTRWGRKSCNNATAELVYEGVVGGSWWEHTGGAVNPLCLPRNPLWNRYQDGLQKYAYIYGSEYEALTTTLFSQKNVQELHNGNMPCAVCRSKTGQSTNMVPGRNVCYQGWALEYQGYLMAGSHAHKKGSMYICVDEAPEVSEAGFRGEDGQLFYSVEARCGSLPCPEYIEGRELTCAVCTK